MAKQVKKCWTIIGEIIRETEKAILVEANYEIWLPKSQVQVWENETTAYPLLYLPNWLYWKNSCAFAKEGCQLYYSETEMYQLRSEEKVVIGKRII